MRYMFGGIGMRLSIIGLIFFAAAVSHVQTAQAETNGGQGSLSMSAGVSYIVKNIKNGGQKDEVTARHLPVIKGGYGLLSNLDLTLKLGLADIEYSGFKGRPDTLYGAGLKFKLFKDTGDRVNVHLAGEVSKFSSSDGNSSADVVDYMGALIISNRAGNITPYGGIKASETEVTFSGSSKLTADRHVGVLGGVDYFVNPNVFFSGEINIFDQQALYLGVGYKF